MNVLWKPLAGAVFFAAVLACVGSPNGMDAAPIGQDRIASPVAAPQAAADSDDDRVEVQLIVLGVVLVTVFGLGTVAYVLRWKLGRTAYTPPGDSGHH